MCAVHVLNAGHLFKLSDHIHRSLDSASTFALGFIPDIDHIRAQSFMDPDYRKEMLLGVFDASGRMVASIMGVNRPWKQGREDVGYIKWILVDPARRREGLGRRLCLNIEKVFIASGIRKLAFGASSPRYFLPGVPGKHDSLASFLTGMGWKRGKERVSILADISGAHLNTEELTVQHRCKRDVRFLSVCHGKHKGLVEFVKREFSGSWAEEVGAAMASASSRSGAVYAEERNGAILGFAAFCGSNPNWFGPMGVDGKHRGTGLGRALFYEAVTVMRDKGYNRIMIPWINGKEQFYSRFFRDFKWCRYWSFIKSDNVEQAVSMPNPQ